MARLTIEVDGQLLDDMAALAERKRLRERTGGMWKDREIDGLQYQLEQRAEW